MPTYRSTDEYLAISPMDEYTPTVEGSRGGPRKTTSWWDSWGDGGWDSEPEGDPIGVVPNRVPIGEPLALLLMALIYLAVVVIRKSCRE